MTLKSFLWHDYETFGADAARDRPSQFAAVRTDPELNETGEPLLLYCQPVIDVLPHPDACLLTGITPQLAARNGLPEPAFAQHIFEAFSLPGTCGVGYNSIRFDDEFSRQLFYRNFFDPYLREWFGGNCRWDLLDVMRLWHALRPEGLDWPQGDNGATSFKLERLSAANGLAHEQAHDALSDVRATLALARRLKSAQPRLFEHALKLRDKKFAASLLDVNAMTPVVHVSSKIPATRGCIALIAPLARHPSNSNCVIGFDLSHDPEELLSLDADELRERVFARQEDLPEGLERIPLKGIHLNKSPMLAPLATLRASDAERWGLDLQAAQATRDTLFAVREALAEKVQAVFAKPEFDETDAELSLYAGFTPDSDKPRLAKLRAASPEAMAGFSGQFADGRYEELLFRSRARHHPQTLSAAEHERWREFVARKLQYDTGLASLTLAQYHSLIAERLERETDYARRNLLLDLRNWPMDSGLEDLLGE